MIKVCEVCKKEYETNYPNKKYCSKECSREAAREADRIRKKREWDLKKKKQSAEEMERRRLKKLEIDKEAEERQKEIKADLEKRLEERDPEAIMKVNNNSSLEYWEAYKENFIQDYYNKNYIRYINDISIYDDDFSNKVIDSIKELGYISSRLVRNK